MSKFLEAGKISSTHGVSGEVKIHPWANSPQFLVKVGTLYYDENGTKIEIEKMRAHKNMVVAKIKGVNTVEEANKLRDKIVYISRDDVKLDEGEYFITDLEGLKVLDSSSGEEYGTLSEVISAPANDVYRVTDAKGKDYLVPVIDDIIDEVNIEGGYVKITPIPGIFED